MICVHHDFGDAHGTVAFAKRDFGNEWHSRHSGDRCGSCSESIAGGDTIGDFHGVGAECTDACFEHVVSLRTIGFDSQAAGRHLLSQGADHVVGIDIDIVAFEGLHVFGVEVDAAAGKSGQVELIDGAVDGVREQELFGAVSLERGAAACLQQSEQCEGSEELLGNSRHWRTAGGPWGPGTGGWGGQRE